MELICHNESGAPIFMSRDIPQGYLEDKDHIVDMDESDQVDETTHELNFEKV